MVACTGFYRRARCGGEPCGARIAALRSVGVPPLWSSLRSVTPTTQELRPCTLASAPDKPRFCRPATEAGPAKSGSVCYHGTRCRARCDIGGLYGIRTRDLCLERANRGFLVYRRPIPLEPFRRREFDFAGVCWVLSLFVSQHGTNLAQIFEFPERVRETDPFS